MEHNICPLYRLYPLLVLNTIITVHVGALTIGFYYLYKEYITLKGHPFLD